MVRACHAPRQLPQNHPSGHRRGGGGRYRGQQSRYWMDNEKERTSLPTLELLAMASRREEGLCWIDPIGQGTELYICFDWVCRSDLDTVLKYVRGALDVFWVITAFVRPKMAMYGWQDIKVQLLPRICLDIALQSLSHQNLTWPTVNLLTYSTVMAWKIPLGLEEDGVGGSQRK